MCGRDYGPHGRHGRFPWPLKMAGALVFIPGFLFLGSWATMLLWNALMPAVFGLGLVSFWQAMGFLVLGRLLFGGPGSRRHGHGFFPRKPRFRDREEWKDHLRDRFAEDMLHKRPRGDWNGHRPARPNGEVSNNESKT